MGKRFLIVGIVALATGLGGIAALGAGPDKDKKTAPGAADSKKGDVKLPAVVTKTFKKAFPNGEITKLDVDVENGVTVYDIEFKDGKVEKETDITADGTMLESTVVIDAKAVPKAAMAAVAKAAAGATMKRIERVEIAYETKDGKAVKLAKPVTRYAVELTKTTEVVVNPDGKVVEPANWGGAKEPKAEAKAEKKDVKGGKKAVKPAKAKAKGDDEDEDDDKGDAKRKKKDVKGGKKAVKPAKAKAKGDDEDEDDDKGDAKREKKDVKGGKKAVKPAKAKAKGDDEDEDDDKGDAKREKKDVKGGKKAVKPAKAKAKGHDDDDDNGDAKTKKKPPPKSNSPVAHTTPSTETRKGPRVTNRLSSGLLGRRGVRALPCESSWLKIPRGCSARSRLGSARRTTPWTLRRTARRDSGGRS